MPCHHPEDTAGLSLTRLEDTAGLSLTRLRCAAAGQDGFPRYGRRLASVHLSIQLPCDATICRSPVVPPFRH